MQYEEGYFYFTKMYNVLDEVEGKEGDFTYFRVWYCVNSHMCNVSPHPEYHGNKGSKNIFETKWIPNTSEMRIEELSNIIRYVVLLLNIARDTISVE